MKPFLVILAFFLSCFHFDGAAACTEEALSCAQILSEESQEDYSSCRKINRELCFISAQAGTLSCGERSNGTSLRLTSIVYKTSCGNGSRLIRSGRVMDIHNFSSFLSGIISISEGPHSTEKYIYSIRFLRL